MQNYWTTFFLLIFVCRVEMKIERKCCREIPMRLAYFFSSFNGHRGHATKFCHMKRLFCDFDEAWS